MQILPCWVRCVVTGLLLALSLHRRSVRCPQPSLLNSSWFEDGVSFSYIGGLHQLSNPIYPTSRPWLGIHLAVGSRGPPPPWPLAAFSSSSAQWCSVNTTPSRGSAHQLRRFARVWRLKPPHERFRRSIRTRIAHPPYQVKCSCGTTKVLSLSTGLFTLYADLNYVQKLCNRPLHG